MKKSPLALVKERFNDKTGLVNAVKALATGDLWIDRVNDDKGLDHVSNAKLLHLHAVLTDVKAKFGSRSALIDEVAKLEKRVKDDGYKARLGKMSTPRLYDAYRAASKRASA